MGRTLAEYIFNEKLQPQRQLLGMGNGEHLTLAMNQGGPSNPAQPNQGGLANNFRQANPAEIEEQRNMLNMPQS